MTKINLLPWRETQRMERAKRFTIMAVGALIFGVLLVGTMYIAISAQWTLQKNRNHDLNKELKDLKKLQTKTATLKEVQKQLLHRMEIVEELQRHRPVAVYLLDSMARLVSNDITLKRLTQKDQTLNIGGTAETAAAISRFMRRMDDSQRFSEPELISIKSIVHNDTALVEFQLRARQLIPNS